MNIKKSFGLAIKLLRNAKKITQEDFSEISSRTYISALERGLYTPTLDKADELAKVIGVHPLTLLTLTYLVEKNEKDLTTLLRQINSELNELEISIIIQ